MRQIVHRWFENYFQNHPLKYLLWYIDFTAMTYYLFDINVDHFHTSSLTCSGILYSEQEAWHQVC